MDANEFLKTTKAYTHSGLPVNMVWDDITRAMEEYRVLGLPTDEGIKNWAYDQSEQNICGDHERGIAMGKVIGAKYILEIIRTNKPLEIKPDDSVISELKEDQLFHVTLVANLMRECVEKQIITPAQRVQVEHYIQNKMGAR